jgi:hypothetical protein
MRSALNEARRLSFIGWDRAECQLLPKAGGIGWTGIGHPQRGCRLPENRGRAPQKMAYSDPSMDFSQELAADSATKHRKQPDDNQHFG